MTFAVSDLMRPAERTSRILRSAQALSVCAGGWPTSVRNTSGHEEGARDARGRPSWSRLRDSTARQPSKTGHEAKEA